MRYQKSNLKIKYNHWFDQKEFKKDYYYLEIFFWNTCSDLKKSLNKLRMVYAAGVCTVSTYT